MSAEQPPQPFSRRSFFKRIGQKLFGDTTPMPPSTSAEAGNQPVLAFLPVIDVPIVTPSPAWFTRPKIVKLRPEYCPDPLPLGSDNKDLLVIYRVVLDYLERCPTTKPDIDVAHQIAAYADVPPALAGALALRAWQDAADLRDIYYQPAEPHRPSNFELLLAG